MTSRRIYAALAGLWLACIMAAAAPEQARACTAPCTKAQIAADIASNWPDNTIGQITPAALRSTVLELVNSYLDVSGASTFTCSAHNFLVSIATLSSYTCAQPAVTDISGFGTGVATALGINVGSAGAFWVNGSAVQISSTLATGTPPFSIASTTNVPNLNASSLNGATFAAPGPIGSGTPSTGAFTTLASTAHTVTSASASALAVGLNGATNPAFDVDASTGSQAAGLKVTGAATGGTVAVAAIDSGSNTNVSIDAKGTGTITLGGTSTGNINTSRAVVGSAGINGQMAANSVKCNNTGAPATSIDCTAAQAQTLIIPTSLYQRSVFTVTGVNFNSANTDNAINITLPAGAIGYRVALIIIGNASASLSTATFGMFTATGGGGIAILSAGTAITVTSNAANTANNGQTFAPGNASTFFYNVTTVYFRVGTAQGSAATGDVTFGVDWVY